MNNDLKFMGLDVPKLDLLKTNNLVNPLTESIAAKQRETERITQKIYNERKQKEADEESYRLESLRYLHAIEQNTASLFTLVELINHCNENQEEMLDIITEILSMAKAKNKKDANDWYNKTIAKISNSVKDAENLAKLTSYATTIYTMVSQLL